LFSTALSINHYLRLSMPGAYAHLTMVNLAKEPGRLEKQGFPPEAIVPVLDYFRFCELGAVSPDYPYLDIAHSSAGEWADRMHYQKTGDMIKAGVEWTKRKKAMCFLLLRGMSPRTSV
jgi:hypothetical protein